MSEMKNTKPERGEQPKYAWPRPETDAPRVPWAGFLRLWATEIDKQMGGEPGRFLGNWLLGLALQAEALGAAGPGEHEALAQAEAEREAAWVAALEAEAEQPGLGMTTLDPDATGSPDGHPSQDEGAHQVWLGAALEVAGDADLDLLISGLDLPDGSGLELMIRIRVRHVVTDIARAGSGETRTSSGAGRRASSAI